MAMAHALTRRELAVSVTGALAALGQTPTPPIPANPDEELKAARAQLEQSADQLSKFSLPMSTEPAFVFKP